MNENIKSQSRFPFIIRRSSFIVFFRSSLILQKKGVGRSDFEASTKDVHRARDGYPC